MQQLFEIFTKDKSRTKQNAIMFAALVYLGVQLDGMKADMAAVKGQIEFLSRRAGYEAPTNHADHAETSTNHLSRL